ncbi:MAG: RagB/SusD family nutrient uptake outer membrane protein [Draconibacterium sp.]|nr:RagB/SusD family nutrient uptake outer membrane protein [Draconibacterium sp.]
MKLKNIKYILSGAILLLASACEDLDQEVKTTLSAEQIYISYERTLTHSVGTYAAIPQGFLSIDNAMRASASDDAEHTIETSSIQKFNTGSWNEFVNPDDVWKDLYTGIRRANQYLVMSDSVDWNNFILYQTPENQQIYANQVAKIKRTKFEVRLLRAYFYFELVKRYGGVPLITKAISYDADISGIKRSPLNDCIQFIVTECDAAINELPETYPNEELGRVTKGVALALKSRVLLYAASDLFNDPSWAGGYANEELIVLTGDRATKWQSAANAAKDLIDLGLYSLEPNYQKVFKSFNNNEVIFTRRNGASNTFEKANYPIGYDLGRSGTTPTQNLVDAYEMANGKAITDPESGYDPQNPYEGRDPRLAMTIITNNSTFKGRPVECWKGGLDGEGVQLATRTGYYLKKYVDENLNLLIGNTSVHSWHIFRLAEIYLNYAEALNEANPGHADIKTYVDLVRNRAGMPALPDGLSQGEMRERIRNERRVELAFEDHRIWDVRRWMIAEETLGVPAKGMEITKIGENTFNYSVKNVENRNFQPKMYFYPIPQSELNIAKGLIQNPLW